MFRKLLLLALLLCSLTGTAYSQQSQFPTYGGGVTNTSGPLTPNAPVIGNGAGDIKTGTVTGNTTQFPTWSGATTASKCVDTDASGNLRVTSLDCSGIGTTFESIYLADQQVGADWCAKVMTADAALGATSGQIWVNTNAGTSACASGITLGINHYIVFLQGGTWALGSQSITLDNGSGIVTDFSSGDGGGAVTITYSATTGTAIKSVNQAVTKNAVRLKGFTLKSLGGAGNTNVGLDSSGIIHVVGEAVSITNFGTQHLMDSAAGGFPEYDDWYNMSYICSSASSGFLGLVLKHSANAQRFYGPRFSRCATQLTLGASGTGTDQVSFNSPTFESADTMAIDVVNAFGVNFSGVTRFEGDPLGIQLEALCTNQVSIETPYWATTTTQVNDLSGCNGYSQGLHYAGTTPTTAGHGVKLASSGTGSAVQSIVVDSGLVASGTVANGTAALGTSAISSGACATVVTSTATGTATTDNIQADFNADPTGVTGYAPSATGILTIIKYPTTNTVNFKVCNNTGASITPGAITLNWRVMR